ncbi:MAG: hypothetical protein ACYTX0_60770, partial [Nostoc sp.]
YLVEKYLSFSTSFPQDKPNDDFNRNCGRFPAIYWHRYCKYSAHSTDNSPTTKILNSITRFKAVSL